MENNLSTEEIQDRILNEKNKYITEKFINNIFKNVGFNHCVKNLEMFQLAMIHSSYLKKNIYDTRNHKLLKDVEPIEYKLRKKCIPLQEKSYETLEFLGDSIFRHALGKYLFLRCNGENEGFLTTNRSKMENEFSLSKLSRKLGLQDYAIIAKNIENSNGRITHINLTEDIFEAFIGALNLEVDDNKTVEFIWLLIESEFDFAEIFRTINDYIGTLKQFFRKNTKYDVSFIDTEIENDNGDTKAGIIIDKKFKSIIKDNKTGEILGLGFGRRKKISQKKAAKDALIKLKIIGNEEDEDEYYE